MAKIMIGFINLITLHIFLSQWRHTLCYMHEYVTRLIENLFNETRYSKLVRPIYNQDNVMEVNITPGIMTFESLDVTTGELLTSLYIQISWIDEFLVWNATEYGGIAKLSLHLDQLWIPPLSQLHGALRESTGQIINPGFAPVIVLPTGFVLLVTSGYYTSRCDIDTSLYPFDAHNCSVSFFSALYDTTQMEISSHLSDFALGLLQDNTAWRHIHTVYNKLTYGNENIAYSLSGISFTITLKRRPTFDLINTYFPILLLTVLNIAINFIPANSGERLSFAITLYLSFVFLTSALVDEMPHVSVNIAFSSYIMLSINALNTASVLWSVFVVRMAGWHTCTKQIPGRLLKIVQWYNKGKSSSKSKVHPPKADSATEDRDYRPETEEPDTDETTGDFEVRNEKNAVTWIDVADVLDKVYFTSILVLVTTVICVMVCLWILSE